MGEAWQDRQKLGGDNGNCAGFAPRARKALSSSGFIENACPWIIRH